MKRILFTLPLYFLLLPTIGYAQSVDILWHGETYTHPFYEGRALWSKQSGMIMQAIPQGLGSPDSLIYKWVQNGTVLGDVSGVGRDDLRFDDSLFSKPQTISVEVVNREGEILAESSVVVNPVDPLVLIYEKSPFYGYAFHKEVGNIFKLIKGEATFAAFPLFTSPAMREGAHLTYRWSTNNGEVETKPSVTYRVPEEGEGTAVVSLEISNNILILPDLTRDFLIQFGESDEE